MIVTRPYSENPDDCDDGDPKTSPDTQWYLDGDGDGLGQCELTKASCLKPEGYANNRQDSDDDDPLVLGFLEQVTVGRDHSCGLRQDGRVVCRGGNSSGQCDVPEGLVFTEISAGYKHTCGLLEDGTPRCWGSADGFEGGPEPTAAPDDPLHTFKELSAGHLYSCAVRDDDEVLCWGTNKHGQGTAPAGENFVKLRSGTVHSCGLTISEEIRCWGSGSFGRTHAPEGLYTDLDLDQLHSCAVGVDGLIRCWGFDDTGQTKPICGD